MKNSDLLKLKKALFSLATFIQQRHLLYRKKESITARKENACQPCKNKVNYKAKKHGAPNDLQAYPCKNKVNLQINVLDT